MSAWNGRYENDIPDPVADDLVETISALNASIARESALRERFNKACDAADMILGRVTAALGRYLYDAPDADLSPLLAEYKVELTALMFMRLYDATDRAGSDDLLDALLKEDGNG